jgi:hypothetical protein
LAIGDVWKPTGAGTNLHGVRQRPSADCVEFSCRTGCSIDWKRDRESSGRGEGWGEISEILKRFHVALQLSSFAALRLEVVGLFLGLVSNGRPIKYGGCGGRCSG